MSCFLQSGSGDIDMTSGKVTIVRDPDQCTAIKLTNRFKLFLGEWFRDSRIGVPYIQLVFVKNPDLGSIGQLFKRVATQTPNVKDVLALGLDFLSSSRQLIAQLKVRTLTGAIIEGGPGVPFIVTQNGKGTQ